MVSVITNLPLDDQLDDRAIGAWVDSLANRFSKEEMELLHDACELASRVHQGEVQASGECTVHYLLSVADILTGLGMDHETLAAALLHDVLRSEIIDIELLRERFSKGVAGMVEDMARIGLVTGIQLDIVQDAEEQHAENLRRMLLSIADDVRVVLIVLAECLHGLRTVKNMPDDVRQRVAIEARDIYAPLANRLGVWQLKWELEDLALRYLEPDAYQDVASQLDGRRGDRERFIADVIKMLQGKFHELGIQADISGRPKHINSIWRKMQRKGVSFDQIFDLRAVRILVDSVADCYATLGVVHGLWRHIPGEFDDYIATPKANMYQSLHTAVVGPGGNNLEVQIRTHDMHQHSELGVAAHWAYKEDSKHDLDFERRIIMMRNWLELKEEEAGAEDFFDRFKSEFEPVLSYVLTPQGKVVELPKGATPVDFAYAIHSDVGHRCRGAKVDGRIVPLTHQLESGHTVEVITAREGGPSRDWLSAHHGYIKTARARNRVRQWFRHQDFEQHVQMGRTTLERELKRLGVGKPNLDKLAKEFNLQKAEDLLAAVGRGDISPVQVAGATGERKRAAPAKKRSPGSTGKGESKGEVIVAGVDDLMTNIARCCKPVPYDPVVGYITQGRGVTVHRQDCTTINRLEESQQSRLVEVVWNDKQIGASYSVDVQVNAQDRKGLLGDISTIFTSEELDILGVVCRTNRKTDMASMQFTVEIADIRQLSRVLNKIAQMSEVYEVRRRV
ncbi:Inactive (p)ppGpp 3'-pyrophosphohydrolase domain / GTP pyrophosphokinase, (p)ppGpp synthetase I [hydrothermal vent metagenome]|uniref:Inactive (P)ppGpp 3'-pyrophosphohydrolase domain / GTP pyrophosphokinase, (P)ppGpp synthetase I n=1 Tax=hydrothermal vent metagenome TaxID=652676 RepID=A0A3B1B8U1_9ZZZZ